VVKKGEHGILFHSAKASFAFPAFPIEKVVDPTGAGDTFAGGLMGSLVRQKKFDIPTFKKAVCYATVLASFNVEGFGVERTQVLTVGQMKKRLKQFLKFISI
jgi:sugar/nucleoside kinase (ribokinase family)